VAVVAALAGSVLGGAPATWADTTGDPASAAIEAAHLADPGPLSPAQQATAQAKASGQSVPVPTLTDAYSTTVANPDGTFTQTQSAVPQRVQKNGTWTDLDATLVANPGGGLSPKTSSEPLTLSAGGNGPLATMATTDGKQLALTVPFALPAPTITGDTALYSGIAAGIDLSVQATPTGGFSTVLIVKNASAAANPLLTHLTFTTSTAGVTVSADAQGNLTAADSTGTAIFSAPTPQVWDSSTTTVSTASSASPSTTSTATTATLAATGTRSANLQAKAATAQVASASASASATPASSPSASADPADASTTEGPGARAQIAPITTTASGSTLTLTPPASALTGPGVTYPVFVDPAWHTDTLGQQAVTWTQSAFSGTNNITNGNDSSSSTASYPGVGVCGDYGNGTGCSPNDTERSYWQFDISAYNAAIINSATFNVSEVYSADASCSNTYPVVAAGIWGTIGSGTTWDNPPAGDTAQFSVNKNVGGAARSGCSNPVSVHFDITPGLKNLYASQGTVDHLVMRLHGDESNIDAFKRFKHAASLTIQYDRVPNPPANLHTSAASGGINAGFFNTSTRKWQSLEYCTSTSVGVDSNWGWVNSSGTTLNASAATSSDFQDQYKVNFRLWDDTVSSSTDAYDATSGYATKGSNVASAKLNVGASSTLKDGHAYGWLTSDSDGLIGDSANSLICHLRVDSTPPTISFGDSTDFPKSGSGLSATKTSADTGTFPITVADTPPAGLSGGQASGVACVRWGWDPTLATAQWQCGGSHTNISEHPLHWGTNILYAQAQDYAGNISQIASYSFYAPWAPSPLAYGDVNGDGKPDVVAPNPATGDLLDYQQARDFTTATATIAAPASQSPDSNADGKGWTSYRVVHRGDITGTANVDDLFVHKDATATTPGDQWLYTYPNLATNNGTFGTSNGSGTAAQKLHRPDCEAANGDCTGSAQGDTWANSSQITPIGSPADNPDPVAGYANGLLDVENGKLWFYAYLGGNGAATTPDANGNFTTTEFAPPVLVDATTDWTNTDLMVPGDAAANGHPSLWARNRTTGAINQYALTFTTATVTSTYSPAIATTTASTCGDTGTAYLCPVNEITGLGTPTLLGTATAAAVPTLGADSDLTGDNIPDLWAQSATGSITIWPGVTSDTTSKTAVKGLGRYDDQWLLAHAGNPVNGTPDATDTPDAANGRNPATAGADTNYAAPTYTTDHPTTPTANGGSAAFNTHNYFTTAQLADSSTDYTLSAWVKLATGYDPNGTYTAICLRDTGGGRCSAYLQYSGALKNWTFISPSNDTGTVTYASATNPTALDPSKPVWTHLVAVFKTGTTASTDTMTLYVNGTYAASATNPTPWANTGGVQLIGGANGGTTTPSTGSFNGNIADARSYGYALTPTEISNLN
jgi:hypothetical protein